MIVWLVGMSGAGKSTIGRHLHTAMKADNPATVLVDGDEIRGIFRQDQGEADYSVAGRRKNARRIQEMCRWLDRQDMDVVCCILSVFRDTLAWNRETYSDYFEVFVDAPFDDLVERNPKNLYKLALSGQTRNVVGVDIEFEPPESPDMHLVNPRPFRPPEDMASQILSALRSRD